VPCFAAAGTRCNSVSQDLIGKSGLDGGGTNVPQCIASRGQVEAAQQASVIFVPCGPFRGSIDPSVVVDPAMLSSAASSGHDQHHQLCHQSALIQSGEDGWFYSGYVADHIVGNLFAVEDQDGKVSSADVCDLLVESRWLFPTRMDDCVLAEHPSYGGAYGPAQVVEVIELEAEDDDNVGNLGVTVQFFDGSSKLMINTQCIRISAAEHQASVRLLELAGAHSV
jgi:hypothetical protein